MASKWGKTKVNYTQLVALHEKYGESQVTFWLLCIYIFLKSIYNTLFLYSTGFENPWISLQSSMCMSYHSQQFTLYTEFPCCKLFSVCSHSLGHKNLGPILKLKHLQPATMWSLTCLPRLMSMEMELILCGNTWRKSKEAHLRSKNSVEKSVMKHIHHILLCMFFLYISIVA